MSILELLYLRRDYLNPTRFAISGWLCFSIMDFDIWLKTLILTDIKIIVQNHDNYEHFDMLYYPFDIQGMYRMVYG